MNSRDLQLILSDVGGTVAGSTSLTSLVSVTRPADILVTALNGYTLQKLYSQFLTLHTHQLIRQKFTVYGTVSAGERWWSGRCSWCLVGW